MILYNIKRVVTFAENVDFFLNNKILKQILKNHYAHLQCVKFPNFNIYFIIFHFQLQNMKWKIGSDNFFHFTPEVPKNDEPIPSKELAEQAIDYARELEMIV